MGCVLSILWTIALMKNFKVKSYCVQKRIKWEKSYNCSDIWWGTVNKKKIIICYFVQYNTFCCRSEKKSKYKDINTLKYFHSRKTSIDIPLTLTIRKRPRRIVKKNSIFLQQIFLWISQYRVCTLELEFKAEHRL